MFDRIIEIYGFKVYESDWLRIKKEADDFFSDCEGWGEFVTTELSRCADEIIVANQ